MIKVKAPKPMSFSALNNLEIFSDPAGIRTQDPIIKSDMLCLLSYRIFDLYAKLLLFLFICKFYSKFFHSIITFSIKHIISE